MKPLLLSFLLGLVLAAPAFGQGAPAGGPTTTPVPRDPGWVNRVNAQTAAAKKLPQVDLIFDGDSITDFWQGTGKTVWDQHYGKLHAFDFGISADRTEHVLWRLQNGQVDGLHPKLVALMIGTNDINDSVEQIAAGTTAVVQDYHKRLPDAVILLQAIFPRGASATDPARAKIKAVNAILSKLDDGKSIIFIDFGDKFLQPDGSLSKDIMPDFLHPSAKGYEIWADAIQPSIDKYVSAAK